MHTPQLCILHVERYRRILEPPTLACIKIEAEREWLGGHYWVHGVLPSSTDRQLMLRLEYRTRHYRR